MSSSTEFTTAIKHVLFRSKQGNALVAKLVIAKTDGEKTGYIQVGRFSKNYAGSKFMITCNREEAEWLVNVIPALIKNARAAKPDKTPIVLEKMDFANERGMELSVSKFRNFKQVDFAQSFVRDDDTATRSVSVPVSELNKISLAIKNLLVAMEIKLNAEQRLTATEPIFQSFLAYLVKTNIGKSLDDPRFTVALDETLLAKMTDGTAPMAYWLTAKYIATHFGEFRQIISDVFQLLDIPQFDEARTTEARIIETLSANYEMMLAPEGKFLFGFTMFIIDNLDSV